MNINNDIKRIVLVVLCLVSGILGSALTILVYSRYAMPIVSTQASSKLDSLKLDGRFDRLVFEAEGHLTQTTNLIEAQAYTDTVVFSVGPSGDVLISGTLTTSGTVGADLDMGGYKIVNVGDSGTDFGDDGSLVTAKGVTITSGDIVVSAEEGNVDIGQPVARSTGTADTDTAGYLEDTGATFQADGVVIGDIAMNTTDNFFAIVEGVDSETELNLTHDVFPDGNEVYIVASGNGLRLNKPDGTDGNAILIWHVDNSAGTAGWKDAWLVYDPQLRGIVLYSDDEILFKWTLDGDEFASSEDIYASYFEVYSDPIAETGYAGQMYSTSGDLIVAATTGADLYLQTGDTAGANKIIFDDSGLNQVGSIDSDGNMAISETLTAASNITSATVIYGVGMDAGDADIDNVADIALDTISADDGSGPVVFAGTSVEIDVASGDPIIVFDTQGADKFTIGVDDSNSDQFEINSGGSLADPSDFELDSTGNLTIAGGLAVGTGTILAVTTADKTADETVNNTTTLQTDDHLVMTGLAVGNWHIHIILFGLQGNSATADFDYAFNFTNETSIIMGCQTFAKGGASGYEQITADADENNIDTAANDEFGLDCDGHVTFDGAGTIQLMWAQEVAAAVDTKLLEHSHIDAHQD